MHVVAQVLVEADGQNRPSAHGLELISDAANLAHALGGVAGAWLLEESQNRTAAPLADCYTELERCGCAYLERLVSNRFANWASELVASVLSDRVAQNCRLILVPGTARGEEVASLLAAHLGTVWIPDVVRMAVMRSGDLEVSAVQPGGRLSRRFRSSRQQDAAAAWPPIVATMRAGVAEVRAAANRAAFVVRDVAVDLTCRGDGSVVRLTQVEEFLPTDPATIDLADAVRIVAGGRGTGGAEGMRLVAKLARCLHASPAASRVAVDLGWAPPWRQVGQTGKTVHPDLYVACGISGASHHLAGMRASKHIIAINPDSRAAIHEVAHLSLLGDLHAVIPAILRAVSRSPA